MFRIALLGLIFGSITHAAGLKPAKPSVAKPPAPVARAPEAPTSPPPTDEAAAELILKSLGSAGSLDKLTGCARCNSIAPTPVKAFASPSRMAAAPSLGIGPGSGASTGPGAANPAIFDEIKKVVDAHQDCLNANVGKGKKIGTAKGFAYGMAMAFARTMCRKDNDPVKQAIMKSGGSGDALQMYAKKLGGMAEGAAAIRKTYVLAMASAQHESDGNFTTGADPGGANKTEAGTEAGFNQISYDYRGNCGGDGAAALKSIQQAFQSQIYSTGKVPPQSILNKASGVPGACFTEVFADGVQKVDDKEYVGSGEGAAFQRLNRECPAASAEINASALRCNKDHFGPIKRDEVEPPMQCEKMLEEVATKAQTSCPSFAPPSGEGVPMS